VPSAEIEKLKAETEKAKAAVDAIHRPVGGAPPLSREESRDRQN
jgi:hypothetical protein